MDRPTSPITFTTRKKRRAYDAAFKLKVVAYAESTNNCEAARKYSLNEKQVRNWRKAKNLLKEMPKSMKAKRGAVSPYLQLEVLVEAWMDNLRQRGIVVTAMMVRKYSLDLYRAKQKEFNLPLTFKASTRWCSGFLRRHDLKVWKKRTTGN